MVNEEIDLNYAQLLKQLTCMRDNLSKLLGFAIHLPVKITRYKPFRF